VLRIEPGSAAATEALEALERAREAQRAADRQLAASMLTAVQA